MRLIIIILSIGLYACHPQVTYPELEILSVSQLQTSDSLRFDLSGIVQKGDKFYVVADKQWNNYIYQIEFVDNYWRISDQRELITVERLDIEAIDVWNDTFIIANEKNGKPYIIANEGILEVINIDFNSRGENPDSWGNAGWEGMAMDRANNVLYLIKERQPRAIYKININTGEVLDKLNIPETESNDFADAKFENGFLYLLERNGNYISKVNPISHEVIAKVTYKHICQMAEGKLYAPEKYGMAEALLLLEDEIWLGLDNNGKQVTQIAIDKFGMKGNMPAIIKFKRPKGF